MLLEVLMEPDNRFSQCLGLKVVEQEIGSRGQISEVDWLWFKVMRSRM